MAEDQYQTFGEEWKKEISKLPKPMIIELAAKMGNEKESSKYEGVLIGLKICKEMWAQGTISHEEIRENEIYYQELLEGIN